MTQKKSYHCPFWCSSKKFATSVALVKTEGNSNLLKNIGSLKVNKNGSPEFTSAHGVGGVICVVEVL